MGISNISHLRTLVKNGWTIANRRAVVSEIGNNSFDDIAQLAKKAGMGGDVFEYQAAKQYLSASNCSNTRGFLREAASIPSPDMKKWGKELNLGKGNWNEEYYGHFRTDLDCGGLSEKSLDIMDKFRTKRRVIFDKCKPLGCNEIHYRGESYASNNQKFSELTQLKVGDIYEPKTNFWISDNAEYAYNTYAPGINPNTRAVRYEILCHPEAKIVQVPYANTFNYGTFTEGIYDDRAKFKVVASELKDNILNLRLEQLKP